MAALFGALQSSFQDQYADLLFSLELLLALLTYFCSNCSSAHCLLLHLHLETLANCLFLFFVLSVLFHFQVRILSRVHYGEPLNPKSWHIIQTMWSGIHLTRMQWAWYDLGTDILLPEYLFKIIA